MLTSVFVVDGASRPGSTCSVALDAHPARLCAVARALALRGHRFHLARAYARASPAPQEFHQGAFLPPHAAAAADLRYVSCHIRLF